MRRYILAVSLIQAMMLCNSQQLRADDTIPDINFPNVLNWPGGSLKLSAIKKKLIILDFWSFGCTACLEAFPKIDSIQREFKDEVQFIAVNNESIASTEKFREIHSRIRFPDIPYITQDSILENFFPRAYVPWHVWIDSGRKVRYITDGYNATRKHISGFLNQMNLSIRQLKYDSAYSGQQSLIGDTQLIKSITYYSYIAHCVPELSVGYYRGKWDEQTYKLSQNCLSVSLLFQKAFEEHDKYDFSFPSTRIFNNPYAASIYEHPSDLDILDDWMKNYCYSYDLMVPVSNADQVYKIMQRDISNFFHLNVKIEKRQIECYSLVRIVKKKLIGLYKSDSDVMNNNSYNYTRENLKDIVTAFNNLLLSRNFKTFITDDTNYLGKISLSLDKTLFDKEINIALINSQLKKYNLKLVHRKITRDVLIINN